MASGDRLNVRHAREAGRLLEFVVHAEGGRKRKPVSSDEYEAILRSAAKASRANRRTPSSSIAGTANPSGVPAWWRALRLPRSPVLLFPGAHGRVRGRAVLVVNQIRTYW